MRSRAPELPNRVTTRTLVSVHDVPIPRLRVVTEALPEPVDLLDMLPPGSVFSWVRRDDGLVAWGEAARVEISGPERFSRAQRWWSQVCDGADITDAVTVPGSGPVAFASFTFDGGPQQSVMVVPQVILGRRHGKSWITTIGTEPRPEILPGDAPASPGKPLSSIEQPNEADWREQVAAAVRRISSGGLDKVVLARKVDVDFAEPVDERYLLHNLADKFPECWTFAVAGLVGATPELLVRRTGTSVVSRVLAGTVHRDGDSSTDGQLAEALLSSDKDLTEHLYAVESVAAALARHCTDLRVPQSPALLQLANVQHLSTDVAGQLADDASAIALAASLHPTAAVCGTPTERAASVISALEDIDRGRYAGPVGWVDAHGDGEFGIALRCGQLSADHTEISLYAGCGIVSGSTPQGEWAESEAKLSAMRNALH
jgi:menaquinone-specific isochorismate synthase